MKTVIVFFLIIVVAVPVLAQPPVDGIYQTTDLGGLMLEGRYSESWIAGNAFAAGNTMNEESWDGATLGTQWRFSCASVVSVQLIGNTVNAAGDGSKFWKVTYTGGVLWLDGAGPWGGGAPDYMATVDTWTAIVTEQYAAFVLVGSIRNVGVEATFVGYGPMCLSIHSKNTEKIGEAGSGGVAADYPSFLDILCTSVAGAGEWGVVNQMSFLVDGCQTVPVQETSWGQLKQLYSD